MEEPGNIHGYFRKSKYNHVFSRQGEPVSLFEEPRNRVLYFTGLREVELGAVKQVLRLKLLLQRCIHRELGVLEDTLLVEDTQTKEFVTCETVTRIDVEKHRGFASDVLRDDGVTESKETMVTRIDFIGELWRWYAAVTVTVRTCDEEDGEQSTQPGNHDTVKPSIVSLGRVRFMDDGIFIERVNLLTSTNTVTVVDSYNRVTEQQFYKILRNSQKTKESRVHTGV
uniref:Putative oxidoreductase GLYR1 n=1 Tax=Lygus hesperus TaxID=30085 RepID=A0A0A9ZDZ8_LYGHE